MAPNTEIKPFQIAVPSSELELLAAKLKHTRLPDIGTASWSEASAENVNPALLGEILTFWREEYDWRGEERRLNELPQFVTEIDVEGFGLVRTHFIHGQSSKDNATPLLFLHGWPGSFIEISKALHLLTESGFDVVAPSHAGWTFSSYPDKPGYNLTHYAEAAHKLVLRLGYDKYFVQGGDWGAHIGRVLSTKYPEHVLGLHLNNLGGVFKAPKTNSQQEVQYTDFEKHHITANHQFNTEGHAYADVQKSTPFTLGLALHDSPLGLLSYILEKLLSWSDSYPRSHTGYKWTSKEIITWVLLHYFADCGPTGSFAIYREFGRNGSGTRLLDGFVHVRVGVSAFFWEAEIVPRLWAEEKVNAVWWREHERGGHFPMYERPEVLVQDIIDFVRSVSESS